MPVIGPFSNSETARVRCLELAIDVLKDGDIDVAADSLLGVAALFVEFVSTGAVPQALTSTSDASAGTEPPRGGDHPNLHAGTEQDSLKALLRIPDGRALDDVMAVLNLQRAQIDLLLLSVAKAEGT